MPLHSKFRIPVVDVDKILLEAQHRWLHTVEAYEILINYWKFELTLEPPYRPPDGSLFLFDRKALRNFRNDGFRWMTRSDGKLVKESHEKLKVCGVDIVHCYYARRDDNDRFQRRIYWLLDRQLEHIVLVHYREVNEGIKPGTSCLQSDRGGDALSTNQHPAWVSRDICSVSTGAPDLAKKDTSVFGASSAQPQNMDRFPSERSVLGEYIFQKRTDWRFKPHLRLSCVAFGENLASSSDHDKLAVHAEQHNQQNKETETHITSASHGNYSGNVYMRRRKKGVGVVSEAGVQKNLSIKEQSIEAVGMESTHIEHGIRMEEQLDKAVGMESTRIEQGDVQKGEGVEKNISVEEHFHEAVGIELMDKDEGHSDLVDDGGMRTGMEGTIVILNEGQNEGQQPESNNDVAAMRHPALALPFVRSSPIWETVESLEIFRKFPQSPHFLPLIDASSGAREGLAIAKMVTFASIAEEAIKLSINDPVSKFTDCLETFQSLEMYGFNVKTFENHLTRLLLMKDMDRKKNMAETRVSDLQHSMVVLDGEIRETVKRMKLHQEELESSMWRKEEKDLEIERLRACLNVLVGLICRNRIEFEELNKSW